MAERNPDDRAAFGVFPQLKRNRSKQDREAAKNVPVDLARGAVAGMLGAPGDIESLIRMLPYIDEKTVLPTSEDIEKRLPFRSDTPVSKAASGLGSLAGGFYYGPGSPLRLAGALPGAIKHGAEEFAKASVAGVPHVIKPVGGNWVPSVGDPKKLKFDPLLNRLKKHNRPQDIPLAQKFAEDARAQGNTEAADMYQRQFDEMVKIEATNKWVDANLRNYIRNEMGSPKDPVRDLADKGIKAFPVDENDFGPMYSRSRVGVKSAREQAGFPEEGVAQTPAGQHYENLTDNLIASGDAKYYQEAQKNPMDPKNFGMPMAPWIQKLAPEEKLYGFRMTPDAPTFDDLGFNHIVDVLREDVATGRIRPEQLSKVSMEQAVRRAHEYDMQKLEEMRKAQLKLDEGLPTYKEYPEGFRWQELRHADDAATEAALKYEGKTMGHCVGGYCPDVLEGRSRIYSLRDAKGEPHVTVETNPGNFDDVWNKLTPEEQAVVRKGAGSWAGDDELFESMKQAFPDKANIPEKIIQIKGKGNAKPKEDYLPFVQDFVKSGNWSDIKDFKNTGLIREGNQIMTPAEHADWLLKQLDVPPEGMKRGGVAISNNPDAMMLELNNQKMAGGGLAKLGKGVKAALKADPETMKASEALGRIEGRPLVITQADRTKVGEGFLGGPGFSSLQLTEPEYRAAEAAWGVKNAGTAKMILGGAKKAGDKPVFTTMIGSPTQHQSNQMVFDKLYGDFKKAAKKGELPTELRDKINDRLVKAVDKEGNPVFPSDIDILDKKFKDIANTFDRRSIAGHLIGGVQVGGKKGQIIDYDKIIRETTDPALIDVPSGSLGNRLFTLSGGIIDRPDLHPAFPTILQGEDLGLSFSPVAKDILMRDFIQKTMREKGRKPGYMDFTRGHPPSQLITEDILTEMQKLGLKEGGAVKKPAAYIDGSEFVEAAKKYGITDSMNNLNKIVDLVNKGLTVDDAARQVSDGMGKAAGGAIVSAAKAEALAKLAKLREEMAPRAEAVKALIAKDENKYLRDVAPNSLTNAEIEAEIARMKARSQASQPEVKKADGGAINYDTAPDMSDGGRIIQGAPFKRGGKVNTTANRDTMFLELSNKKLKRK
jgi:hypothetical protein